jgi:hypothetical protein
MGVLNPLFFSSALRSAGIEVILFTPSNTAYNFLASFNTSSEMSITTTAQCPWLSVKGVV